MQNQAQTIDTMTRILKADETDLIWAKHDPHDQHTTQTIQSNLNHGLSDSNVQ